MKRPTRPDITAAEAARVGEDLRESRLTLGASVEDMAERLRINRRYIHALEEGRIKDLPGPAYAVGFVRSYATALGLDADEAVRRFRDVTGGATTKNGELVFPEPVLSRGMPAGVLVAVGVVVALGAYVAWYNWSGSGNRVVDAVPPVPSRLDQAAQDGQRMRDPATGQAVGPAPAPTQAAAAGNPGASVPAAAPPAPAAPVAAPVPDGPRVMLRARGEAWIQIRDTRANSVLTDRVLRTGESLPVPSRDGLVLTTGKAENLDVLLDGQVTAALAGATGVRRGIALEVERLRAAGGPEAPARPAAPAAAAPPAAA
ncbi:helix-turn-helix domain-containing protein, partial [Roseomonas sp. CECT 9278]|uniref:helix-turn-helix domain-containing protein n=1 Tax=Roseomonas sp. CECT 9278 TaxID=2845823 RepID=UPI001E3AF529